MIYHVPSTCDVTLSRHIPFPARETHALELRNIFRHLLCRPRRFVGVDGVQRLQTAAKGISLFLCNASLECRTLHPWTGGGEYVEVFASCNESVPRPVGKVVPILY
jgi:hypothetical protein